MNFRFSYTYTGRIVVRFDNNSRILTETTHAYTSQEECAAITRIRAQEIAKALEGASGHKVTMFIDAIGRGLDIINPE